MWSILDPMKKDMDHMFISRIGLIYHLDFRVFHFMPDRPYYKLRLWMPSISADMQGPHTCRNAEASREGALFYGTSKIDDRNRWIQTHCFLDDGLEVGQVLHIGLFRMPALADMGVQFLLRLFQCVTVVQ